MSDDKLEAQLRLDAQESQREELFLSPWIQKYVPHFRQSNQDWYDYARELNRLGLSIARVTGDVVLGPSTLDSVCIAYRLLLRAICDFEASVILAERGIVDQADLLTRSVYEAGFWMGYLHRNGDGAATAMLKDSQASDRAALKFERKLVVLQHGENSEKVREIDKAITSQPKGRPQKIQELADHSGYKKFYTIYKDLSSSVAHTSLRSLHSFMKDNGDGTYDGHIVGPDEDRISPSLSNACLALCLNLRSYSEIVGSSSFDDQLQELLLRWDKIPNL